MLVMAGWSALDGGVGDVVVLRRQGGDPVQDRVQIGVLVVPGGGVQR